MSLCMVSIYNFWCLKFYQFRFWFANIIFSIINCITHIAGGFKHKNWNPGLVIASTQLLISLFVAYYVSVHLSDNPIAWWSATIIFSIIAHMLLFKFVMAKD